MRHLIRRKIFAGLEQAQASLSGKQSKQDLETITAQTKEAQDNREINGGGRRAHREGAKFANHFLYDLKGQLELVNCVKRLVNLSTFPNF